jgi:hypothetical protein
MSLYVGVDTAAKPGGKRLLFYDDLCSGEHNAPG